MEFTREEKIAQLKRGVQDNLDLEARKRGYGNINSIAKYQGYDNAFRAETEALGKWVADVWAYVHAEFNKLSESDPVPTIEEVVLKLPKLEG